MTEQTNAEQWAAIANSRLPSIRKPVRWLIGVAAIAGIAALVNGLAIEGSRERFWQGYLVAFAFVLSISLGSLFFVLVQHLMRAGWSVVIRRFAEIFCLNILVVGILFLPIGWSVWKGDGRIYRWAVLDGGPEVAKAPTATSASPSTLRLVAHTSARSSAGDSSAHADVEHQVFKPYLRRSRFLVTWALLFSIWIGLAIFFYWNSVAQDRSSTVNRTLRMEWWSGIAIILFGFSLTYGAFDLLMSLNPEWYSTIFGVYYFAGCAVAGLAVLLLVILFAKHLRLVPAVISAEVQRDVGRLLFAFVFFWAYIGFSQYMLLWYANMPETAGWLVARGVSTATGYTNSWGWLAIFLLISNFMLPFAGIMSRHVKSSDRAMIFWAIWLLVVHYLDLYWIVIPETQSQWTMSFVEIGTAVAVLAVYGLSALWIASRQNLFAAGDPRMEESLTRHAFY